jgi:hypothetical protein
MTSVTTVVVGFILTGVIGNWLVQAWQTRNWLIQQRFAGQEKEYLALKELADEIAGLLGTRMYHMQRLASNLLHSSDEKLAARVADYDDALKRWNERLTSFYVRLPLLASYDLTYRLERSIQVPLVDTGSNLEKLLNARQSGSVLDQKSIVKIQNRLNSIQGRVVSFNKEMLHTVEARRTEVYYGKKVGYSQENLEHFSTWQLVKAIFVRDVNSLSVTRSSLDS